MGEKFRIVYDFDGRILTISDGAGGSTLMPRLGMAAIAAEAINANLAGEPCDCGRCNLLRAARDTLRNGAGMKRIVGSDPQLIDRAKMF